MIGYALAVGVILVTGAYAIPVGNQDQDVDPAFLRRPSLEDELRDLPYEDLTKVDDEGNTHGMQLIASPSDSGFASRTQEQLDSSPDHPEAAASAQQTPPAPPPSHLIDIDSNVHQTALLSSPPDAVAEEEHEWRPEDDEKDDSNDNDDVTDDDDEDDDEEDDEDETAAVVKPTIGGDIIAGGDGDHQFPSEASKMAPVVEKKSESDHEKRATSQAPPPAYIREAYFLAKEDKTESSVSGDETSSDAPTAERKNADAPVPISSADAEQTSRRAATEGSGGQKEQFAEVVVKLADVDDLHHDQDGHQDHHDDQAVATNRHDDENGNQGVKPTSGGLERRMGDPEVSNGNPQNRGSSPMMSDEPVAMASTAAEETVATPTTDLDHDSTSRPSGPDGTASAADDEDDDDDDDEEDEQDLLESELEEEEGRIKDEISERERSIGAGRRLAKKVVPMDTQKLKNAADKDESANEDILELIIKVAERPSSWKEIKELLEKIQYEENTLNKAKARLRALAKQKQMKNRKEQRNKENKLGKNRTKYQPQKDLHNDTVSKEHNFNRAEMTPGEQPKVGGRRLANGVSHHQEAPPLSPQVGRVPLLRNDDIIKAAVFPSAVRHTSHSDDNGHHPQHVKQPPPQQQKGHRGNHHGRRPGNNDEQHDFAIEKPVTVIGERSRIDPVEKELIEASTNQRLREIQKEKARLAAIPEPTDEMEQQLKALTKMERRLKEHWRQKQKLMQKIRETNEEHAKW